LLLLAAFYWPAATWLARTLRTGDSSNPATAGDTFAAGAAANLGVYLFNTLAIAGGAALIAGILGTSAAVGLTAAGATERRWLSAFLLLPFFLPTVVVTCAANALLAGGPLHFLLRGLTGAIFLSVVQMAPVVVWGVARAIDCVPLAERHALANLLAPARARWTVLLPRVRAPACGYAVLVFALLIPRLEIPGYAGVNQVLGYRVLSAFSLGGNERAGWWWTALSVLPAGALWGIGVGWERNRRRQRDAPQALVQPFAPPAPASRARAIASWLPVAIGGMALGVLAWRAAGGLDGPSIRYLWAGLAGECVRCALLAVFLSYLGVRLAVAHGVLRERARRAASGVAFVLLLPLLMPGTLPGLVLAGEVQQHLPDAVGRWPVLLTLAHFVRYLGLAFLLSVLALRAVPPAEWAAARMLRPATRCDAVLASRVLRVSGGRTALWLFVLVIGEVESAVLLVPPGYVSPAVEIHQFLHFRADEHAFLFSAILGVVGIVALLAASRWEEAPAPARPGCDR
jgi:ABC-type Fe3+ transport system permease subunit